MTDKSFLVILSLVCILAQLSTSSAECQNSLGLGNYYNPDYYFIPVPKFNYNRPKEIRKPLHYNYQPVTYDTLHTGIEEALKDLKLEEKPMLQEEKKQPETKKGEIKYAVEMEKQEDLSLKDFLTSDFEKFKQEITGKKAEEIEEKPDYKVALEKKIIESSGIGQTENKKEEEEDSGEGENDEHNHHHQHHHDKNAHYKFEYAVNDKKTKDIKHQKEELRGDKIEGEYSLVEDDGNVRTVKYTADWKNGFRAQVHNSKRNNY